MSNDILQLYHPPKPTLRIPNPRRGDLIIEISVELLVNTSSWALQKHIDGTLFHSTTIPQGLDYWIVRNILSWIDYVARKMGTEDPEEWGGIVTSLGTFGKSEDVAIWKLNITGRFDRFGNWVDAYLAYTTLGIHGGPLNQMRAYILSKITAFLDDAIIVLDIVDVLRVWDVFYTFHDNVCKDGDVVLKKTMGKIVNVCEGNKDMEGYYIWGFRDAGKPEVVKYFLGFIIEGPKYPFPPKVKDEEVAPEEKYGSIPLLVLEGESSNGLNWRNVEPGTGLLDENKLHVHWRPTQRGSFYCDDVDMEDAPALGEVPELVEEPSAILEDDGDEEWEGDFGDD